MAPEQDRIRADLATAPSRLYAESAPLIMTVFPLISMIRLKSPQNERTFQTIGWNAAFDALQLIPFILLIGQTEEDDPPPFFSFSLPLLKVSCPAWSAVPFYAVAPLSQNFL